MARINEHYRKLAAGYLFPEIGRRVRAFAKEHPDAANDVIRLGIGDVTQPLAPAIVDAMKTAVEEMAVAATFKGYGPEQGYDFLIDAIRQHDYASRGVQIAGDEIFVSDGSKCDSGNLQELFDARATMAVADPVYPVYVDSNVMAGRTGAQGADGRYPGLLYLPCTEANRFVPEPPSQPVDVVYLCSPNNPTGTVMTREQLAAWVAWANRTGAIIVFDAAYEAFVRDPSLPRSIYEIPGAKTCAIEMRSFSKRAGFTGVRCAFTVVPKELEGTLPGGEKASLNAMWARRQTTKFNGASFVVQRGAAAVYTPAGLKETAAQIDAYMENARLLREGLARAGFTVYGGENAPYIWLKTRGPRSASPSEVGRGGDRGPSEGPRSVTKDAMASWDFFNLLLAKAHVVGTPGSGFGPSGEGFFRLSAFNSRDNVVEAIARIQRAFA